MTAEENAILFEQRRGPYPFHVDSDRGSPAKFHKAYPLIWFLRFPLWDRTVWAFESQADLETYKLWCKDKPIVLPRWRK